MKKTRFLVLSAAALLAACSGGTVTGPDEAGPRFEGTPMMGSGAFTTEPETGSTVQSGTGTTTGSTTEPAPGEGDDTRMGTSMMGSGG